MLENPIASVVLFAAALLTTGLLGRLIGHPPAANRLEALDGLHAAADRYLLHHLSIHRSPRDAAGGAYFAMVGQVISSHPQQ